MKSGLMAVLGVALGASCGGGQTTSPAKPGPQAAPSAGAAGPACPARISDAAVAQGGACLEAEVLGFEVVAACDDWLIEHGWLRDSEAERVIGAQAGKQVTCYHIPGVRP